MIEFIVGLFIGVGSGFMLAALLGANANDYYIDDYYVQNAQKHTEKFSEFLCEEFRAFGEVFLAICAKMESLIQKSLWGIY